MKKIFAVLISVITVCLALTSCAGSEADDGKIKIVCTSHVVADWVENIIPQDVACEVVFVGKMGTDMHNYQPTAADVKNMSKGDLLVYIGGESDKWVKDVDFGSRSPEMLKLMDYVQGVECDVEHTDGHNHSNEADEHIWLSFENALSCTSAIADAIAAVDPENSTVYTDNLKQYQNSINAVYDEYKTALKTSKYDTLVFADRFPFVYLMHELGVKYYAAFPGCSSENNAGFKTVISLAQKVDELSLPCVLTIEDSSASIAQAVIENTASKSAAILSLDSMQVCGTGEFDYVETMRKNLDVLKTALGCN